MDIDEPPKIGQWCLLVRPCAAEEDDPISHFAVGRFMALDIYGDPLLLSEMLDGVAVEYAFGHLDLSKGERWSVEEVIAWLPIPDPKDVWGTYPEAWLESTCEGCGALQTSCSCCAASHEHDVSVSFQHEGTTDFESDDDLPHTTHEVDDQW